MKLNLLPFIVLLLASNFSLMAQPPAPNPAPSDASGTPGPNRLRVLSYNIYHANPPGHAGVIDIETIAKVIKAEEPDIVALQEVDVNTERSGKVDQAKLLARLTGMKHHYFAKAIDHDGGQYGVAILTNLQALSFHTFSLPDDPSLPSKPRVLATASLKTPERHEFVLAVTHLNHTYESNRLIQLKEVGYKANHGSKLWIIAGDFNAQPGSRTIKSLDSLTQRTCSQYAPLSPSQARPGQGLHRLPVGGKVQGHSPPGHQADLRL